MTRRAHSAEERGGVDAGDRMIDANDFKCMKTATPSHRRAATLVEVVVVGFVLVVLIGLILPALLKGREASRMVRCQNNLKRIGIALHNYHDAHRLFPAAAESWNKFPDMQYASNGILLRFFEQVSLVDWAPGFYSWQNEDPRCVKWFIGYYFCPSHTRDGLTEDEFIGSLADVGSTFGTTSYVYCKGVSDAWCGAPKKIGAHERGAFDADVWTGIGDITDGPSHTIVVGEGATGNTWHVCRGVGCKQPVNNPLTGGRELPDQPYLVPFINTDKTIDEAGPRASLFASTMEPMNKNPVTDTFIDSSALTDCRSSADGGPHRTSNFRSSHADGAFFLFGDGSVRFLDEGIDMQLYRALSTIAGDEDVDEF